MATIVLASCLVSSLWITPLAAQDAQSLLEDGVTRFREGNFPAAVAAFEQALSADPTNDEILTFLTAAHHQAVLAMVVSDDPKISAIGRTILELGRKSARAKSSDEDAIQAAIEEFFQTSGQEALVLRVRHSATFGRNLVPALVEKLADVEVDARAKAETWIRHIGRDAVPVLTAAAKHPSVHARISIANLLGMASLRHPFSAATLAEMAAVDEDATVRSRAEASLNAVLAASGEATRREAKQYHLANARFLYLNPHKNDFHQPFYEPTVYSLQDGKVAGERVVDFQLNERMAGQALYSALKLDPNFVAARQMMLCNDVLLVSEYDRGVELYGDNADAQAILESQKTAMDYIVRPRVLAADRATLFGALGLALADQNGNVAEGVLRAVRETSRRGLMSPTERDTLLGALLETSSRRVRVQAAAALAEWNPAQLDANAREMVVSVLAEAIQNSGVRVAHKVMGNPDNVRRFDALAREGLNLESFTNSQTISAGIARAGQLPPDLIVIDDEARSGRGQGSVGHFISMIRGMARTANVPIIVVLGRYDDETYRAVFEKPENMVWAVPSEGEDVRAKFQHAVEQAFADVEDARTRALELGVEAATVLAVISSSKDFPVARAVGTLTEILGSRPESVQLPSLVALGNLRDAAAGSAGTIAQIFAASDNSVELREAAMTAVGKILNGSPAAATQDILGIIHNGMQDSNLALRRASYFAFSAANSGGDALERLYDAEPPTGGNATASRSTPSFSFEAQ